MANEGDDKKGKGDSEDPKSMSATELSREAKSAFVGAARTASALHRKFSAGDFAAVAVDPHGRTQLQPESQRKLEAAPRPPKKRLIDPLEAFTPSPLPSKPLSSERMKGILPHAVHHWVVRSFGEAAVHAVAKKLPDSIASRFDTDAFNTLEWCSLEEVHVLLETIAGSLARGDATLFRALAEENYPFEFAGLFRSTSKTPDLVVKRSPIAWSRILDFGRVRADDAEGSLTLRFEDFSRVGIPLRQIILGTMSALLATGEPVATVEIARGGDAFSDELVLASRWPSG